MNDLRDKLLLEDGIDPTIVSERELTEFRTLLAREQRRARRLGWMIQIPLWGAALLLLGVCLGEDLWDRFNIPFLAVSSLAIIAMWLAILIFSRPLTRRLGGTQSRIRQLKDRLPEHAGTESRGIPLLAREGDRPMIFWPGVLSIIVLVSLTAAAVGNGLWLILTGKMSGPVVGWQIAMGLLLVAAIIRHGLTRPLSELRELDHPNHLLWMAVPRVFAFRVPRTVKITSFTCLLTALGIAAGVSFLQGGTVYAKALSRLKHARSTRAVAYGFEGARPVRQSEIRHIRDVGTQIRWQQGERLIEMYDDGRDRYEYVEGNEYAIKREGQGRLLPRELVEPLRYLQGARRDASQDRTLDGVPCLGYRREDPNNLALMWVDEAMRFRRYEEYRRVEDRWQQEERVEVAYDEPFELEMPPGVFERQGIRIVEPEQILETRYGLENTLAATEVLGLTFAVHELHKCGEYLLVTCSVRPTVQSLDDLRKAGYEEPVPDHMSLGGFNLSSWWQRRADGSLEERPYAITELGHLRHRGTDVRWYALLARGRWPGQDREFEVCAHVRTDHTLRQFRRQQGLQAQGQFRPLVTVALPSAQSDLAGLAKDLYELGHTVTAVGQGAQDLFVSEGSGTTVEQFRQRLEGMLTGLRPMGELWDRVGSDLNLQLVDERGAPVAGAWSGSRVEYSDGSIHPDVDVVPQASDDHGRLSLPGEQLFDRDWPQGSPVMVYIAHPERQLVACRAVRGDDFGSPLQMVMAPACRVGIRFEHPDMKGDEGTTFHVSVYTSVPRGYSLNSILLNVLRCSTRERWIEIALPPGEYEFYCDATHAGVSLSGHRRFTVPADARTLDLGTVEMTERP